MKQKIRLSESTLHRIIKESVRRILREDYDLDSEMEIWKQRSESEFGKCLKKIDKKVTNLLGTSADEYGFHNSPIGQIITAYSLDGDKMYTARAIKSMLENYDMLNNGDRYLDNLVRKLFMLAKSE